MHLAKRVQENRKRKGAGAAPFLIDDTRCFPVVPVLYDASPALAVAPMTLMKTGLE